MNAKLVPAALLDPVVAFFNPRRVILFGSVARGEAGPDSDIDLLVIVDDDAPADKITLKAGVESRRPYGQPADVIPVREATFQRKSKIANTLSRAAALELTTPLIFYPLDLAPIRADSLPDGGISWMRLRHGHRIVGTAGWWTAKRHPRIH